MGSCSRSAVGLLAAGALLLTAGATAAQAADPPRLTAHTVGTVRSPVLPNLRQALKGTLSAVRPAVGARPVALTIVDGDAFRGRRLARTARVARALRAGKWVLALDVSDKDRRAVQRLTGFSAGPGFASAVLFRRSGAASGNTVRIVESRVTARRGPRQPTVEAERTAQMVADELRVSLAAAGRSAAGRTAPVAVRASGSGSGGTPPPELLHVQWSYTTRGEGQSGIAYAGTTDQTPNWLVNYTYDAYLDNKGQRPQGSFQWVTASVDGSFSPKLASERFSGDGDQSIGFWTGAADLSVGPLRGDVNALNLFQTTPETQNAETEYSSGTSFSIGFKGTAEGSARDGPKVGAGVDLSYKVEESKKWKVTDWAVRGTSDPSLDRGAWAFAARNPCDYRDRVPSRANNCFATTSRGPGQPNELSKGNLPFHASAAWRTSEVLRRPVTFEAGLSFSLVNTYSDYCSIVVCFDQSWLQKQLTPSAGQHQVDLGAVVPVGIRSLTFSPGDTVPAGTRVIAGTPVTGQLTLAAPAPMDLTIPLFSSTPNATVDTNVQISKGTTTGTFRILTNDNGIKAGERLTATIAAFYAEPTREQLVLTRPVS